MGNILISAATVDDYPAILTLNDGAVPHVNSIAREKLEHLHRQSAYLGVARDAGTVAGFLLGLRETAVYDSMNFGYFKGRYGSFLYIDRIVVHPDYRGRGVGAALYADLEMNLSPECALLTCEVNLRPPNPGSLRFHQGMGFCPVGEQDTEGGSKRVCLLAKPLDRAPAAPA